MSDPKLRVGSARCKCAGCGEYFGGPSGFDLHHRLDKDGDLRCLDPASVGLVLGPSGFWSRPAPNLNCGVARNGASAPEPVAQDLAPAIAGG